MYMWGGGPRPSRNVNFPFSLPPSFHLYFLLSCYKILFSMLIFLFYTSQFFFFFFLKKEERSHKWILVARFLLSFYIFLSWYPPLAHACSIRFLLFYLLLFARCIRTILNNKNRLWLPTTNPQTRTLKKQNRCTSIGDHLKKSFLSFSSSSWLSLISPTNLKAGYLSQAAAAAGYTAAANAAAVRAYAANAAAATQPAVAYAAVPAR